MLGIGQKVLVKNFRDSSLVQPSTSLPVLSEANKLQSSEKNVSGCNCSLSGNFICFGHSATETPNNNSINSSSSTENLETTQFSNQIGSEIKVSETKTDIATAEVNQCSLNRKSSSPPPLLSIDSLPNKQIPLENNFQEENCKDSALKEKTNDVLKSNASVLKNNIDASPDIIIDPVKIATEKNSPTSSSEKHKRHQESEKIICSSEKSENFPDIVECTPLNLNEHSKESKSKNMAVFKRIFVSPESNKSSKVMPSTTDNHLTTKDGLKIPSSKKEVNNKKSQNSLKRKHSSVEETNTLPNKQPHIDKQDEIVLQRETTLNEGNEVDIDIDIIDEDAGGDDIRELLLAQCKKNKDLGKYIL